MLLLFGPTIIYFHIKTTVMKTIYTQSYIVVAVHCCLALDMKQYGGLATKLFGLMSKQQQQQHLDFFLMFGTFMLNILHMMQHRHNNTKCSFFIINNMVNNFYNHGAFYY